MQIFALPAVTTQTRLSSPRFGSFLVWDVGASDPVSGTAKGRLYTEAGIRVEDLPSRRVAPNGVSSSDEFVQELGHRSKEVLLRHADLLKKDPLTQVVIFTPGVMEGTTNKVMENVKNKTGQPLLNLDYGALSSHLAEYAKPEQPVKISLANDMMGAGSAAIAEMHAHPELRDKLKTDGYKALLAMMGGGLGVIEIQRQGDNVVLNATEGGHVTPIWRARGAEKNPVIETDTTSSGALIKNIARRLDLPAEEMAKTSDLRLIMGMPMTFQKDHHVLPILQKTGQFDIQPKSDKEVTVRLNLPTEQVQQAGLGAIQDLIKGMTQVAQVEAVKGTNALIVFGHVKDSVDKFLRQFQGEARQFFGLPQNEIPTFQKLLTAELHNQSDEAGHAMMKSSGFEVRTDLGITNNAEGGAVFRNAQPVAKWSYRFKIPAPVEKT